MRIVICDDHAVFGEALAVVLRDRGHDVVACVTSPDDAVAAVAGNQVDLCMMDLSFPGDSGVEGTAAVIRTSPGTQVVVVTGTADRALLSDVVQAGARGIATKTDDIEGIIAILDRVYAGERVLDALEALPAPPSPSNPLDRFLTQREKEVLRHLAMGESTADLARSLGIRYSTARTHIQSTLTKLGVHSKLEAVVYAVSNNLVPFPEAPAPDKDA